MSDQIEEDDFDFEDDTGFDEGEEEARSVTLGDLWDNALVKIAVIAVVAGVVIFGVMSLTGDGDEEVAQSVMRAGSDIKAPPGLDEATPAYVEEVRQQNEERVEEAVETGQSVLPTPVGAPEERLGVPEQEIVEEEDPLQRWRQLQEERLQRELQQTRSLDGPVVDPEQIARKEEEIAQEAELLSQQMDLVLQNLSNREQRSFGGMKSLTVTPVVDGEAMQAMNAASSGGPTSEAPPEEEAVEQVTILPAGEISYGFLITEANSDVPGPVLAQVVSGPFNGARMLGSFAVESDYITLQFNTLVFRGRTIGIDAVAIDPDTTLPGMATEVDHRFLTRVAIPVAVSFIEGFASAYAETTTEAVESDSGAVAQTTEAPEFEEEVGAAVEEGASKLGSALDEIYGDVETLVRIHAGTAIGVLFLEDVTVDRNLF